MPRLGRLKRLPTNRHPGTSEGDARLFAGRVASSLATYQAVLQPPWPLQAFWALQAFLSVLQAPCPLQSFCPLQACFAGVVAAPLAADAGAAAFAEAALFAGGVESPQPIRMPP